MVLTYNEAIHLERCMASVIDLAHEIVVVDCGSTDDTSKIARRFGASVFHNPWVNYSTQFKFAVSKVNSNCKWIMRLDADEYLTEELKVSVSDFLINTSDGISGVFFRRRMAFMGRKIIYGGVFPAEMLRLFRAGRGSIECRWMDEHIKVEGKTVVLNGELIDDNLNSLTWWIDKHNKYASREAIDMLNLQFGFMEYDSVASMSGDSQASLKRWVKEKVYSRMPMGFRAFAYFFYRYVIRLGVLDGKEGAMFHFLQGFWYRYLVDCKVYEVKKCMREQSVGIKAAIKNVLNIEL
ncbi:glycosyltransferase family 2 protein [Limnobacter parvus]|uniref:Glycosyltransferase family 2 protein n=1 Tax=Limnobacter parvus TaxID=2939690 RepID=A0ABT1XD57_9BURK|nr:glycosyltransferase family 2 protein [Limnobacter parvus]